MLYLILFDFSTVRRSRTLFIIEQCEWRRTTQSPLAIELIQATALFHKEELLSSGFEICIYIYVHFFKKYIRIRRTPRRISTRKERGEQTRKVEFDR